MREKVTGGLDHHGNSTALEVYSTDIQEDGPELRVRGKGTSRRHQGAVMNVDLAVLIVIFAMCLLSSSSSTLTAIRRKGH